MATKAIPVVAAKVPSTQTDFPVYIKPSTMTGWGSLTLAEAQSTRWYSDSGLTVELAREVVDADEIWVKVSSLTSSTTIYVDYDGIDADYAATDTYGRNAVWSAFNHVWHFKESSGSANDSTSNARNLTNVGTTPYAAGLMGNAADFGTTNTGKSFTLANAGGINPSAFTMSTWLKMRTDITTTGATLFYTHRYDAGGVRNDLNIHYQTASSIRQLFFNRSKPGVADQGPTYDVTLGTSDWHQIVFTYDGTNIRGYLNGSLVAGPSAASGGGSGGANSVNIGGYSWGRLTAYMDLTKSINSALSADWVATEYNNQSDVASFWGTVTDAGGGGGSPTSPLMMMGVGT
jgi:hypothetical protein